MNWWNAGNACITLVWLSTALSSHLIGPLLIPCSGFSTKFFHTKYCEAASTSMSSSLYAADIHAYIRSELFSYNWIYLFSSDRLSDLLLAYLHTERHMEGQFDYWKQRKPTLLEPECCMMMWYTDTTISWYTDILIYWYTDILIYWYLDILIHM